MVEDDDSGEAESTADRQVVAAQNSILENDGSQDTRTNSGLSSTNT